MEALTCHDIDSVSLVWDQPFNILDNEIDVVLLHSDERLKKCKSIFGLLKMKQTRGSQVDSREDPILR